jgi:hypothetical protein
MPSIILDEWMDLGVRGCRSITVRQRRTVPGFFEMQSPISYWTMDEASGARLDSFGLNDVVEGTGPVPATPGVINNAAIGYSGGFLFKNGATGLWTYATGITMAGWFFFKDAALSDPGNNGTCGFGLLGAGGERFRMAALADGNLYAESRTSIGLTSQALFSGVVQNTFLFIRMWADPADNKVHCKINEGPTQDGASAMTPANIPALNLTFVQTPLSDCYIDEVGIYAGVMNDTDGAFLYNSGVGNRPTLP